ncbi:flagellar basal body L-ring protein FlgH [Halanaerobium sp. Z-7514]|uniref:Flagellar L-ring protein n=1 Tax=Halanaerobium polyolivorans TaxID=2886943 RepID=A0AAW4WZY1_9FIRM|nr:flagellar basal body L-ring protein FlgH [Halanaerobium polyolivorans]MCC3145179.1 flagellar basal body L-ring protein FlgH [Halanaerobium polyolivorans]
MLKRKSLIMILIIVFLAGSSVSAVSLWSEEASGLYQDYPNYNVGDIITVVIEENANAVQSANSDASQDSNYSSSSSGLLDFIPFFDFSYSDSQSADGATQRSGTLEADITTRITELQENGNLKIVGTKTVKINGEIQEIKLEGVIRANDINFNNEVSSKRVAEANIEYQGEGTVGDKQRQGLLSRFFNRIF